MIEWLSGRLLRKSPTFLVLDVQGVGYGLHVSLKCSELLNEGDSASLPCQMVVRENAIELFGFASQVEKDVWNALVSVNGVGPRLAQRILSEASPEQLVDWICTGKADALMKLKGIGKKTSEMLVLELQSKLAKWQGLFAGAVGTQSHAFPEYEEALLALVTLGLKEAPARKALDAALAELGEQAVLSAVIGKALRHA